MDTIKALIVDDEPIARRTIRDLLSADQQVEIIGECDNGVEAVAFIENRRPDLLFLDIQMPGLSGFETLARLRPAEIPTTIFVTAYDQYALRAFEVHALDYLLKPFTDQRFEEALRAAKSHIELQQMGEIRERLATLLRVDLDSRPVPANRKNFLTRFMIKTNGRVLPLRVSDVDWIAADDYFIKLHVGPKSHLLRMSMNELEEKLDPDKFLRIHRSTIVNFDRINELQQTAGGEYLVKLNDGTKLKLSRGRRERLHQLLANSTD